jgi:hypothetical protein
MELPTGAPAPGWTGEWVQLSKQPNGSAVVADDDGQRPHLARLRSCTGRLVTRGVTKTRREGGDAARQVRHLRTVFALLRRYATRGVGSDETSGGLLITQRSQVQILSPLRRNTRSKAGSRKIENRPLIICPSFVRGTSCQGSGGAAFGAKPGHANRGFRSRTAGDPGPPAS